MSDQPPQQPGEQPAPEGPPPSGRPAPYGPPSGGGPRQPSVYGPGQPSGQRSGYSPGQPTGYGPGQVPGYGPGQPTGYGPSPAPGYSASQQPMFGPPHPAYPQQDLLPQQVQPGRSRRPLVIVLVVALLVAGGGVGAWLLLRDNGESGRAAYCAQFKKLVPDNDLVSAVTSADASTAANLKKLADQAPATVHKDWQTLTALIDQLQNSASQPNLAQLATAFGALKQVIRDANDHCGMSMQVPSLP
jgi:hypothetical protein